MNRSSLRINPLWKTYFFIASMSVLFTAAATFVDYQRIEESARKEVVPLIRTTCLGVIFPVNHAAINGMMVS